MLVNFPPNWEYYTYGLQGLLDLSAQGTGLESDDLGSGIGIVSDRRATLRAENAVDSVAGGALARPLLGRTVDGQLVLGNDRDQSYLGVSNYILNLFHLCHSE